jgi:hypothetical protein
VDLMVPSLLVRLDSHSKPRGRRLDNEPAVKRPEFELCSMDCAGGPMPVRLSRNRQRTVRQGSTRECHIIQIDASGASSS